jgi:hypothetical protein
VCGGGGGYDRAQAAHAPAALPLSATAAGPLWKGTKKALGPCPQADRRGRDRANAIPEVAKVFLELAACAYRDVEDNVLV